jgi:hypothetical protein
MMGFKMADDLNEGTENALNVIVSTTGSSRNMKKELKTTIFDTVSILRKLFVKLLDTNESSARKITELERQAANTNASRGEVTSRTNNCTAEPSRAQAERQVANTNEAKPRVEQITTAEPSGTSARAPYCQLERTVSPPGGGKVMLYSEVVEGRTRPKRY